MPMSNSLFMQSWVHTPSLSKARDSVPTWLVLFCVKSSLKHGRRHVTRTAVRCAPSLDRRVSSPEQSASNPSPRCQSSDNIRQRPIAGRTDAAWFDLLRVSADRLLSVLPDVARRSWKHQPIYTDYIDKFMSVNRTCTFLQLRALSIHVSDWVLWAKQGKHIIGDLSPQASPPPDTRRLRAAYEHA